MGPTVLEVIPPAVGMMLVNPVPMTAVILLLFSPRAKVSGPAFVVGWVLGMSLVFGLLLLFVPGDTLHQQTREPSTIASIVRLLLGIGLLYLASRQWRQRSGSDDDATPPQWMLRLEQARPFKIMWFGAALSSLNPKDLMLTVSAFVIVAQADLSRNAQIIAFSVYVLIASLGVATPVIWYFLRQERATKILATWRIWLAANHATLMTIVLLLFGVILSMRGLGELTG